MKKKPHEENYTRGGVPLHAAFTVSLYLLL